MSEERARQDSGSAPLAQAHVLNATGRTRYCEYCGVKMLAGDSHDCPEPESRAGFQPAEGMDAEGLTGDFPSRKHSDAAWERRCDSLRAELTASQERAEKAEREFRDAAAQAERCRQVTIVAQQRTNLIAVELEKSDDDLAASQERERVLREQLAEERERLDWLAKNEVVQQEVGSDGWMLPERRLRAAIDARLGKERRHDLDPL